MVEFHLNTFQALLPCSCWYCPLGGSLSFEVAQLSSERVFGTFRWCNTFNCDLSFKNISKLHSHWIQSIFELPSVTSWCPSVIQTPFCLCPYLCSPCLHFNSYTETPSPPFSPQVSDWPQPIVLSVTVSVCAGVRERWSDMATPKQAPGPATHSQSEKSLSASFSSLDPALLLGRPSAQVALSSPAITTRFRTSCGEGSGEALKSIIYETGLGLYFSPPAGCLGGHNNRMMDIAFGFDKTGHSVYLGDSALSRNTSNSLPETITPLLWQLEPSWKNRNGECTSEKLAFGRKLLIHRLKTILQLQLDCKEMYTSQKVSQINGTKSLLCPISPSNFLAESWHIVLFVNLGLGAAAPSSCLAIGHIGWGLEKPSLSV